jgi:hypothetical protein
LLRHGELFALRARSIENSYKVKLGYEPIADELRAPGISTTTVSNSVNIGAVIID